MRPVTRLAMLGYSVSVDAICDKPLSDVVYSVIGAGHRTEHSAVGPGSTGTSRATGRPSSARLGVLS